MINTIRNKLTFFLWMLTGGNFFKNRKEMLFPSADNHFTAESGLYTRREIVKNLAVLPVIGLAFWGTVQKNMGWNSFEEDQLSLKIKENPDRSSLKTQDERLKDLQGKVPSGRIRDLEISRIVMGGNLLSGFAHSRDLIYVSNMLREYHTDEKVIETLFLCEECGINSALLRTDEHVIRVMDKYRNLGGKMKWIAQSRPGLEDMDRIKWAIDSGAASVYTQGGRSDSLLESNRLDRIHDAIELIKSHGIPAGVGSHSLDVTVACEKEGLDPDYYMKTLHHYNYWSAPPKEERGKISPSSWSPNTEETIAFMETVEKPFIAFKVFAAGAIPPKDGLQFAFENGADFTCIGMFDFQVVENSNITYQLFQDEIRRKRPWRG